MTFLLLLGDSWANYIFLLIHWEFCAMCLDHIHPLPIIHLRSALFFYVPNAVSFEKRKTSCSICTTYMFLNMCHFTAVCLIYQRVPYKKNTYSPFHSNYQLSILPWPGMEWNVLTSLSILRFCLAWVCTGSLHALLTVTFYVQLPLCVQKILFPYPPHLAFPLCLLFCNNT